MAITKPTQKDIGNYEAKFIGPFTGRQCALIAIGLVPSALVGYTMYRSGVYYGNIFATILLITIIPGFFAFGKKLTYGLNPEDYIMDYYFYHIKAPNVRKYETQTLDDKLYKVKKKSTTSKKYKKDPMYPSYR